MADDQKLVSYPDLTRLVTDLFAANHLPRHDAQRVAECILDAELRGVTSHGIARIPVYLKRLRQKLINPTPLLRVEQGTPVMARVDGDNGMGFIVGTKAMAEAITRATTYGVGMVWAYHSNHFGMAASYLKQAIDAGMGAIVLTNAPAAMAVWGGMTPFLGTNPLAIAVPGGPVPLVLDMATSLVAKGKIRKAAQRGEPIPEGWALDEKGKPTTNAEEASRGVVLPMGGPKGSGMALLTEALAGVLSGAAFGGDVRNQYSDFEAPQNVGHFFQAFRTDVFMTRQQYSERISTLISRAKACPLADGFNEIVMPGERETRLADKRRKEGVQIARTDLDMLAAEAATAGVKPL